MKPIDYPVWFKIVSVATVLLFALNVGFVAVPVHAFFVRAIPLISGHDLLVGLGTVAASFFGAAFAFVFAWYQRRRERIAENVTGGNRALFTLGTMRNVLEQYRKEFVEPSRGMADAWLNFNLGPPLPTNLSFDVKDLSFLMSRGAGGTFQQLMLEEERYRLVAFAVAEHRRLILEEAWPRMEAAGMSLGDKRPEQDVVKIVGPGTSQQLKVTVESLTRNVDENLKSTKEVFSRLQTVLKKVYPRESFINFSF